VRSGRLVATLITLAATLIEWRPVGA